MPWSKMLFPLLFLALGAACLWAAWVFRRFAKKRETAYTVKAWAQVVQVLASASRWRTGVYRGSPSESAEHSTCTTWAQAFTV